MKREFHRPTNHMVKKRYILPSNLKNYLYVVNGRQAVYIICIPRVCYVIEKSCIFENIKTCKIAIITRLMWMS